MLLQIILAAYNTPEEKNQVTELFQAHSKTMYNEALCILHSHHDAEDAVAEAFIRIHNQLEKLEDIQSGKTRGYLTLVAKNVARNMRRKYRRENAIAFDERLYEIPSQDEEIFSQLEVEAMLAEIRHLSDIHQEILLLKYRHQCSDKELAEIMHIKHDVVRKRLERARASLLERLCIEI